MINHINLLIKKVIYNKVYDYKKSKKSSQMSNGEVVAIRSEIFLDLLAPLLFIYGGGKGGLRDLSPAE